MILLGNKKRKVFQNEKEFEEKKESLWAWKLETVNFYFLMLGCLIK